MDEALSRRPVGVGVKDAVDRRRERAGPGHPDRNPSLCQLRHSRAFTGARQVAQCFPDGPHRLRQAPPGGLAGGSGGVGGDVPSINCRGSLTLFDPSGIPDYPQRRRIQYSPPPDRQRYLGLVFRGKLDPTFPLALRLRNTVKMAWIDRMMLCCNRTRAPKETAYARKDRFSAENCPVVGAIGPVS
jgi:hypothetical protein